MQKSLLASSRRRTNQHLSKNLTQCLSHKSVTLFGGMNVVGKNVGPSALSKHGHEINHWHSIFPGDLSKNLLSIDLIACRHLLSCGPDLQNWSAASFTAPPKHQSNLFGKLRFGKAWARSRRCTS